MRASAVSNHFFGGGIFLSPFIDIVAELNDKLAGVSEGNKSSNGDRKLPVKFEFEN